MIQVVTGDITVLAVAAVVNAANSSLLGGGGVDGAIHRAAGPMLLDICKQLGGCPTGEARITPGFNLNAEWIIHTVGPIWQGGSQGEPDMLKSCYDNCFELAKQHSVDTIAFPSISTGVYGYPKQAAARIAVASMKSHEFDFERIICCCFASQDEPIYKEVLCIR